MGRKKNTIQQPATVHKLKSGKFAVLVTLLQPRSLGGKECGLRPKWEFQTEPEAIDACAEINAELFGLQLAPRMSKDEVELLTPVILRLRQEHPEWIGKFPELIEHAEKTDFSAKEKEFPTIMEAGMCFYREHVCHLEWDAQRNSFNTLGYLFPVFGKHRSNQLTDQQIVKFAHGKGPVKFLGMARPSYRNAGPVENRVWKVLKKSKGARPWTPHSINHFLANVRNFKNWMAQSKDPQTQQPRGWCSPCHIETKSAADINKEELKKKAAELKISVDDLELLKNPKLTMEQAQALLDVCWVVYHGKFAPFYVHAMFCASRSKETARTSTTAFDSEGGRLGIGENTSKTDKGRDAEVFPVAIILVEALRRNGLYTKEGLNPTQTERGVIQYLAGFQYEDKLVISRAECERKRLEAQGIILPRYNWGIPFPSNALRRTALSAHYMVFGSVKLTTEFGGNSPGVFKDYYKRLMTKIEARQYWTMLPRWLNANSRINVALPKGHKLDSAMTQDLTSSVEAASQAAAAFIKQTNKSAAESTLKRATDWKAYRRDYDKKRREAAKQRKTPVACDASESCEKVAIPA